MQFIKKLPLPFAGVALALATLGNLLRSYSPLIRDCCGILAAIILVGLTARLLLDWPAVRKELENVLILSTLPAYFMASMILSTYVAPSFPQPAFLWWAVAFAGQLMLTFYFSWRYLRGLKIASVFPSWFLIYVGYVAAGITSPAYGLKVSVGQPVFYIGLACYLLTLPLVCYRVFAFKQIPDPAKPILGIFVAPANLCIVGYLAAFEQRSEGLVTLMLALSLISAFCFLLYLPRLLRLPFYPSYAALTFPLVIFSLALKQVNATDLVLAAGALTPLVTITEVLATSMVAYVLWRYLAFLWQASPAKVVSKGG